MRIFSLIIIILLILIVYAYASVAGTGQVQRSEELIGQEQALQEKIEKPEKFLIKNIEIDGAVFLNQDQLSEIKELFEDRWLTKNDIEQLIDLIKQAYDETGRLDDIKDITYEIKKNTLQIKIEQVE